MKKNYRSVWIAGCLLLAFIHSLRAQTTNVIANNTVEIMLKGNKHVYAFGANRLSNRFDYNQSQFEFELPLDAVHGLNKRSDLAIFRAVFLGNDPDSSDIPANFRLVVPMPDYGEGFNQYRTVQTLRLTGECTLGGRFYKVPVRMELFYTDNMLYYDLALELTAGGRPIQVPFTIASLELDEIQLFVPDGKMEVYLRN